MLQSCPPPCDVGGPLTLLCWCASAPGVGCGQGGQTGVDLEGGSPGLLRQTGQEEEDQRLMQLRWKVWSQGVV